MRNVIVLSALIIIGCATVGESVFEYFKTNTELRSENRVLRSIIEAADKRLKALPEATYEDNLMDVLIEYEIEIARCLIDFKSILSED